MKVILMRDVRGVGTKDEVKIVSDGYAMNYLFPHNLAVVATHEKVQALEAARAAHDAEAQVQEELLAGAVRSAEGQRVELAARATPKGGLFKAIGAPEIVRALKEQKNITVSESSILLEHPLKTTGEHVVELKHKNAHSKVTVVITPQA